MLMTIIAPVRNRTGATRCLSRLTFLTRATKTEIIQHFARQLPRPGDADCMNHKGVSRVGTCVRTYSSHTTHNRLLTSNRPYRRINVIVFSSRLSPHRLHIVRRSLRIGVLSHAALVLSVFTVQTRATRTGMRIRLTRGGCVLPHLRHL